MVLKCDQCHLFFRSETKLKNHKKGDLGFKCSKPLPAKMSLESQALSLAMPLSRNIYTKTSSIHNKHEQNHNKSNQKSKLGKEDLYLFQSGPESRMAATVSGLLELLVAAGRRIIPSVVRELGSGGEEEEGRQLTRLLLRMLEHQVLPQEQEEGGARRGKGQEEGGDRREKGQDEGGARRKKGQEERCAWQGQEEGGDRRGMAQEEMRVSRGKAQEQNEGGARIERSQEKEVLGASCPDEDWPPSQGPGGEMVDEEDQELLEVLNHLATNTSTPVIHPAAPPDPSGAPQTPAPCRSSPASTPAPSPGPDLWTPWSPAPAPDRTLSTPASSKPKSNPMLTKTQSNPTLPSSLSPPVPAILPSTPASSTSSPFPDDSLFSCSSLLPPAQTKPWWAGRKIRIKSEIKEKHKTEAKKEKPELEDDKIVQSASKAKTAEVAIKDDKPPATHAQKECDKDNNPELNKLPLKGDLQKKTPVTSKAETVKSLEAVAASVDADATKATEENVANVECVETGPVVVVATKDTAESVVTVEKVATKDTVENVVTVEKVATKDTVENVVTGQGDSGGAKSRAARRAEKRKARREEEEDRDKRRK